MKRLLRSTYVDDILAGADSDDEGFELYAQAKEIFRQGGFNLRKFLSNSRALQTRIDVAEGVSDSESDPHIDSMPTEKEEVKVLGVTWNLGSDSIVFDLSDLSIAAGNLQPSKRNLISLIGWFYDPLGFLAPVIIRFKILLQKLGQSKLDWDRDLPEALLREWSSLVTDLKETNPISVPRS